MRHEEGQSRALACNSGCSTNSVDVFFDLAAGVVLDYPGDALEIETTRGNVGADHDRSYGLAIVVGLGLVESEEVLLSLLVLHLTMKLANIALEQKLISWFSLLGIFTLIFTCLCIVLESPSAFVPIVLVQHRGYEICLLAIADEYNYLLMLMGIQEGQQIYQSVLSCYFNIELLNLFWNAGHHIFYFIDFCGVTFVARCLHAEANFCIVVHQPRPQSFYLGIHRSRHKVDAKLLA
jgi:hypothetical protein